MKLILYVLLLGLATTMLLIANHPAKAAGQSPVILSYNITGGGTNSSAVLYYVSNGAKVNTSLTQTPTTYAIDQGTVWTASRSLPGSNSTERWQFKGDNPSGNSGSKPLVLSYYRQYLAAFGFTVVGSIKGMIAPLVNFTAFGKPQSLQAGYADWVDYQSTYAYGVAHGNRSGVRWFAGAGTSGVVNGRVRVSPKYYQQYYEVFSLSTKGADAVPPISLGTTFLGVAIQTQLGGSGLSMWVDAGTLFSFPPVINSGSPDQRWTFHSVDAASAVSPANLKVVYYEQYVFVLSFSISAGAAPSPPVLTAIANGQQTSFQMYPSGPAVWVDLSSTYSVSSLLLGSTSGERWITIEGTSGVVNGPKSLALSYYHQVQVSFSYTAIGGGDLPASDASFFDFGKNMTSPIGTAVGNAWADYGTSFVVPGGHDDAGSGGRWILGSAPSLILLEPATLSLHYYHQYQIVVTYSLSNGGHAPPDNLTGIAFGKQIMASIPSSAILWLDGESTWSVSQVLSRHTSGERWSAVGATGGTVNGSATIHALYEHQYFVSTSSNSPGGGTFTQPGWVPADSPFGLSVAPNEGWRFMEWVGTGADSYTGPTENATITVSAPVNETASFGAAFTIEAVGKGTLMVSYGSKIFAVANAALVLYVPPGSSVTINAEPGILSLFDRWSGASGSNQNPATFDITSPTQIRGVFVANAGLEYSMIAGVWLATLYFAAYLVRRRGISFGSHRRIMSRRD
ncbi:MAG: hypothetical protein OK438_00690 [Thaumarchaeota archaeon]|nr:hypothetical protein [Nitrososphaerota archaeon]